MQGSNPGSCVTGCKFCFMHHYGVYVLAPGTFLLMAVIGWIYWEEFTAFCSGRLRPLGRRKQQRSGEPVPQFQQPLDMNRGPDAVLVQGTDAQFMDQTQNQNQDQPVIESPPQPVMVTTPPPASPPATPPQPSPPPAQPISPTPRPAKKAAPSPLSRIGTNTKVDAFKTGTKDDTIKEHESTGSNYFKQMMQGKKNVASISQYNVKGKHKKTKDSKKKHHHHHHKGDKKK